MNKLLQHKRKKDHIDLKAKLVREKIKAMANLRASEKYCLSLIIFLRNDPSKMERETRMAMNMKMDEIEKAIFDKQKNVSLISLINRFFYLSIFIERGQK